MKNLLLLLLIFALFSINTFGQCSLNITTTSATCNYNCDGSAVALITGATPPISIYWSAGSATSSTDSIFNICPGTNYSCSIFDAIGCSSTVSFSIASPSPITFLSDSIHNVSCYGLSDGNATVFPTGGTPPYSYDWGNGQTTQHATGLFSNNYYVNVTDSNGCSYGQNIFIDSPTLIKDTVDMMYQPMCSNASGFISILTSGGFVGQGYNYIWNTGGLTNNISNLAPGIYTVTVSDITGCTIVDRYVLNSYDGPQPVVTWNNITCNGYNNGSVTNVTGINPPPIATALWSTGQNTLLPYPSNLPPNEYLLTVSTAIGCNGYAFFNVTEPSLLTEIPSIFNISCFGDSTGIIYLEPLGGIPPYTCTWGPPLTGNQSFMAYDLHAGTYPVTITDANGCTLTENNVITQNTQIIANVTPVDVSCNGNGDGYVIFNLAGGVPPYYFSLDGGQTWDSSDTMWLAPNTYNVDIKDSNYCYLSAIPFSIVEPPLFYVDSATVQPSCTNNDGLIHLSAIGGVQPYNFSWNNGAVDSVLVNLPQGNYAVTVTDAHGCIYQQYFFLLPSSFPAKLWGDISYSGGSVNANDAEVFLFKQATGMTQIDTISSMINSASTWEFQNLMPGTYYLKTNILNPVSYPNVLNTYYDSTFTWSLANAITLNCNDTTYINFKMFESTFSNSGSGSLSGTVFMYTNTKAVGEPVPGAEILVEQEPNDVPIKSAVTDTTGKYSVGGLEIGSGYHLLVDIPGLPLMSTYQNIAFTVTDTVHNNLNFLVDTITGTGIYADSVNYVQFVTRGINVNVYPNPFTSNINLSIMLNNPEVVGVDLFDALGRKIQSIESKEILAGNHEIKITPNTKINGSCFLMIRIGNNVFVKKLISNQK